MSEKQPTYANGKICYLEIPSNDLEISASFYSKSFGWKIRHQGDGSPSFDDGVGEVSGMWVLGKKPMSEPGIIISIMVDDTEATKKLLVANGGSVVFEMSMDSGEKIVHFTDPAGNVMGLYQQNPG
jgi:predicted enzyme related to lactoylglutathione lyase